MHPLPYQAGYIDYYHDNVVVLLYGSNVTFLAMSWVLGVMVSVDWCIIFLASEQSVHATHLHLTTNNVLKC